MITPDTLKTLCSLANLSVSEEEKEALEKDLEAMVSFAERIKKSSLDNKYTYMEAPDITEGRLREDIPSPSLDPKAVLLNAFFTENGFFLVKGNP